MKTKILILSTIYPSPDITIVNNTNVVHYFAKEWVKMGYEVLVVHNYPIYLKPLHWIAALLGGATIASQFNTSVTSTYVKDDYEFDMDGVKVIRMPLFKPFPHLKVPQHSLLRQVKKICDFCTKNNFIPDFITAHNFYPHIEIVNMLKEHYYPLSKTCVVVHKQNLKMLNYIKGDCREQIDKIDMWGFRSIPLKREFEGYVGKISSYFMCYSGIPGNFVTHSSHCLIKKPIDKFVYIGSFIKRKHPEKLLSALKVVNIPNFRLTYVGDGILRKHIEKFVRQNHWEKRVNICGFVKRESIPTIISEAQCFILISEEETFGLVYLEAMSLGCITIASKNEGMEGIIIDGENGFLCKAGDSNDLVKIINRINNLSDEKLVSISDKARSTALKLTDENVAKAYIDAVIKLK